MNLTSNFKWQCPSCQQMLERRQNAWQCSNNHCFDSAKEGYVNLLLAQHKNSKAPGDSKEMVLARQSFLESGYYQPLAEKIGAIITDQLHAQGKSHFSLFDAGCGEGYYTEQVLNQLNQHISSVTISGIDISKPAIQKAAKRKKNINLAVASTYQIPLANESQNAVFQVFAPSSEQEIHRILKTDGIWISVNPAENHLFELKQMIYDKPAKHKAPDEISSNFTTQSEFRISFEIELRCAQQRENLLMMTPFFWTISESKKRYVIEQLNSVNTDFAISVYQKSTVD